MLGHTLCLCLSLIGQSARCLRYLLRQQEALVPLIALSYPPVSTLHTHTALRWTGTGTETVRSWYHKFDLFKTEFLAFFLKFQAF